MKSDLSRLIEMFKKLHIEGWDTSSALKWGFYFVDEDKVKLNKIFDELKDSDYVLEDIYKHEDSDGEWTLHASKVDTLTPEKLHRRNMAFNELADHFEVLYDGWDVEKIKQ